MMYLPKLAPDIEFKPDYKTPLRLLTACPAYQASPLKKFRLDDTCTLFLKDETARMGLGSFKALGGVYAVVRLIGERIYPNRAIESIVFSDKDVRDLASNFTFVCASAGNHGLSVAAGARIFGARARIHISASVPASFSQRLAEQGAEVVHSGEIYEESMQAAQEDTETTGAILLADGSWVGHTKPPSLVMEGYTVIAEELRQTFEADGLWPDAVYLQAGVGGFAAGIAHMIRENWSEQPRIIVVEPEAAPCIKTSVAEGCPVRVTGPNSDMGRLDCKEPSQLALKTLQRTTDAFVLVSEQEAHAATEFAAGLGFATTPSGAAGIAAALRDTAHRPLAIVSEGAI